MNIDGLSGDAKILCEFRTSGGAVFGDVFNYQLSGRHEAGSISNYIVNYSFKLLSIIVEYCQLIYKV